MNKKLIVAILSLCMVFTVMAQPVWAGDDEEIYQKISDTFGMPIEDIEGIELSELSYMVEDIENGAEVVGEDTVFVKITESRKGIYEMEEYTEDEAVKEHVYAPISYSISSTATDSTSWMKIKSILLSVDSTHGAAALNAEWINTPSFRLCDIMGIHLKYGDVVRNTGYGYFICKYNQNGTIKSKRTSISNFKYSTSGMTGHARLYNPTDYPVVGDTGYLYCRFEKTGSREAIDTSYWHQQLRLNLNPTISIGATEITISPSVGVTYSEAQGYVVENW